MPSMRASAVPLPSSMTRMPAPAFSPSTPPLPDTNARSPVMVASLPGVGSGPDAVLRQFNGGRAVPKARIFVP